MDKGMTELAVQWGSAMSATCIENGFVPMVLIAGKPVGDDNYDLSVACAPGIDTEVIKAALVEVLMMMSDGSYHIERVDFDYIS